MAMEFKLDQPIDELVPGKISFNFDALKDDLTEKLEKYQGMVVTEDDIPGARKDRASLNKLRTSIEDVRKLVKRKVNEPYVAFEQQVKELVALIDQPIGDIDRQLKLYESRRKEEKLSAIKQYFDEHSEYFGGNLAYEKIADGRWLNASMPMAEVLKELDDKLEGVKCDLLLIPDICPDNVTWAIDYYYQTLDIRRTKDEYIRTQEAQKRIEGNLKKKKDVPVKKETMAPEKPKSVDAQEEKLWQMDFRVWATAEQIGNLKQYLVDNNIKFGRVQ